MGRECGGACISEAVYRKTWYASIAAPGCNTDCQGLLGFLTLLLRPPHWVHLAIRCKVSYSLITLCKGTVGWPLFNIIALTLE